MCCITSSNRSGPYTIIRIQELWSLYLADWPYINISTLQKQSFLNYILNYWVVFITSMYYNYAKHLPTYSAQIHTDEQSVPGSKYIVNLDQFTHELAKVYCFIHVFTWGRSKNPTNIAEHHNYMYIVVRTQKICRARELSGGLCKEFFVVPTIPQSYNILYIVAYMHMYMYLIRIW